MKKYEAYKESGVNWIGEIPEHWEIKKMKWITSIKRGASPRPIADTKYFDDENGEFSWVRIADVSASERYLLETKERLSELGSSLSVKRYPGDFFLSIAGSVGKPIITKIKCCIHDGFVWFPELKLNPEFLYYIFQSDLPFGGLGKVGTQLNLNTETIGNIQIPSISDEDVTSIVNYLDHKTQIIDALITKKEQLLKKLQAQRQAIINEAVTKGLNKKVKLKDSGIEWLGDIPEEWGKMKMKNGCEFILDGTHSSFKRVDKGYRLLSVRNIVNNKFIFRDDDSCVSEKDFLEISAKFKILKGDIQLAIVGATLGKSALVADMNEEFVTQRSVATIRTNQNKLLNKFLYYFIKSNSFQSYLWLNASYSAQPGVYLGTLQNCNIPTPNIKEQNKIINFIEKEFELNEKINKKLLSQIKKLKAYRQSIISEAVTGKIDVRDWQDPTK